MKKVKLYNINKDLSKEMYLKFQSIVQFKGCYDNVYNIVNATQMWRNKDFEGYKICYGAWSVDIESNLYAKHCFFVKDGKVVDPTYFTTTESDRKYIVFKSYTPSEYLEVIGKLNGDISLTYVLNNIQMKLFKYGIMLVG